MLTGQRRVSRISRYHLARLLNQNYPRPPCAHAEKLIGTTFARLVSINREDFAYYQYNEENDTSLSGGT